MRREWWIVVGVLGIVWGETLYGEEAVSPAQPPWSINRWARCDDARPGFGDATKDVASAKYLHIELTVPPTASDANLHQFKIVDARGQVVAEVYGFHARRSIVVFEGDWSRPEGLYLAGFGHREPLITGRPARQAIEPAREHRAVAKPEPPVVSSRRPSQPAPPPRGQGSAPVTEETFEQELLVTHLSRMNIQGMDFSGEIQYRVRSVLNVEKREADGTMMVVQRVEQAESIKADPLTQSILRDLLGKLVGATFRISVGPDGRVTAFEGAVPRMHAAAGNGLLGPQGIQMVSIIDPDGWREIAELSFFRPQATSEGKPHWERPINHSWGPLGTWSGKVVYTPIESEGNVLQFSYRLFLTHGPPRQDGGRLPFRVIRAEFQHQQAGGVIAFDAAKGRVVRAREEFPVKGRLTVGVVGQEFPVGLDETQRFVIHLRERKPAVEPRRDE